MKIYIIILILILSKVNTSFAQLSFTTTTVPSTCSANGSIAVSVTGVSAPFLYQIISSSTGIIRPAQNVPLFQNLPAGTYTIRVTDANNITEVNQAIIAGNYLPLSFTSSQQQSTVTIQPVNGKGPFTFSISTDGGRTFSVPVDSNKFHCLKTGSYVFRVFDSCSNFYTEAVSVAPVTIVADFSCIANTTNNTKSIVLNSIVNGNGGYIFRAYGVNYDQTNNFGSFFNINRCNKNISVKIKDRCNDSSNYVVCPSPDYTFNVTCVNFKDRKVTIGNISSGSDLPYQYIANDVLSSSTIVQNFPVPGDSILVGLMDSCGFKNTIEVRRMKIFQDSFNSCENGNIKINTFYEIAGRSYSFQPTIYTSISGPTPFRITDTITRDTSRAEFTGLQSGKYVYKITNSCGDEIIDSFTYIKKCFKQITVRKKQTCSTVDVKLIKDCIIDTNTVYTLTDLQGNILAQNTFGLFSGLKKDSCYKIKMHSLDCDTILWDYINPIRLKLKLFQNACDIITLSIKPQVKRFCGNSYASAFTETAEYVLTDSLFNILRISSIANINPVPRGTYWIYAMTAECNSDTLKYTQRSGFADSLIFCITPSVKIGNNNRCRFTWNVKIMNNTTNTNLTLSGNGVNILGVRDFYGIDSGSYVIRDGCNEQELFLPDYYDFKSMINPGCPSNASVTASYQINTDYFNRLSLKYNFSICNPSPMDYNIKEIGSNNPLIYSSSGYFNNLKTGTYYAIFFKGNEDCNFHSDTIFTPFYTRPALKATYGLICNGNNATVKASVIGGTPPYTYEVLNSAIPRIVTDSNYVLYNTLPLGTAQFRVNDACGISTDYSTEVLSVNFQPTFKKKCDGQVQLIAPDIFNTTYVWTNKNHDTIGTTPIVYTQPVGNDTFTVSIKHLTCSIIKSLYVSDFSSSIVNANAGFDFSSDTTFTRLQGSTPPLNTVGSWRQIDPSSGNTLFTDINNPQTNIKVDIFPGQYTYIWSITDTTIGCVDEDTVVVSFLRCPNIKPILYTKNIQNASCTDNGQITILITQAATAVHFLWNTGDTTSVIKNLKDTVYTVIISDETSCTPDITDTITVIGTNPSFRIINDTLCNGDTVIVNGKKYFAAGIFADTLLNRSGCDSILTIQLYILPKHEIFDSIILCSNETYTLPNGQIISRPGNYMVQLKNGYGCDSLLHFNFEFLPVNETIIDTFICNGFSYQLPGGNSVTATGNYTDTLTNKFGCDSIIITKLTVRDTLRNLFLGKDTAICAGDKLNLILQFPSKVNYLWHDYSTQNNFIVLKEGIYFVKISDGCTFISDTINVSIKDCSCNFYIPTAFSPNNDGVNDHFAPIIKCEYFKDYRLQIFSRWGELMFQTDDIDQGWNGKHKNTDQQLDTYIWTLRYFDILLNELIDKKGSILLIR